MSSHSLCAALLAACSLLVAPAAADTIHVPADAPTIQAAVDLALDGDTVLVAPGAYVENVVVADKGLALRGAGADVTTIRAPGGTAVSITFTTDTPPFVTLDGFTITGGTGTLVSQPGTTLRVGGGVFVDGPSPFTTSTKVFVRGCVIRGNEADQGGGLWSSQGVQITDSVIERNEASGDGGGLWLLAGVAVSAVERCVIRENVAGEDGGGFASSGGRASLFDCDVVGNVAGADGGGGRGIASSEFRAPVDVRFVDNRAGRDGGGYALRRVIGNSTVPLVVSGLVFVDNRAERDGGGLFVLNDVAGPTFLVTTVDVDGLVAVGNHAAGSGGAVSTSTGKGPCTLSASTFVGNTADVSADQLALDGDDVALVDAIVWDVGADPFGASPPEVSWSQVQQGWPGVGNDDADPQFIDAAAGDFGLRGGSPCIDSGDPAGAVDADGTRGDRGALPFEGWVDVGAALAGATGAPTLVGEGLNLPNAATTLTLTGAASLAPVVFVTGFAELSAPFKGGTLVPTPDFLVFGFTTDANGALALQGQWSPSLPSGDESYVQLWIIDPTGPAGWAASNALKAVTR